MKLACQDILIPGRDFKEKLENLEKYGFEGIEICDAGFKVLKVLNIMDILDWNVV